MKPTNLLFSVQIILAVEFRGLKLTKAHVFSLFHHLSLAYPCKAQLIKIKLALPAFVLLQKLSLCAYINLSCSQYKHCPLAEMTRRPNTVALTLYITDSYDIGWSMKVINQSQVNHLQF